MHIHKFYENLRLQQRLEMLEENEARTRKKFHKLTPGQKKFVQNKLTWTITDLARCIEHGYALIATISTVYVAYRMVYTDYVRAHDDALKYKKQFRPRYIQFIKKNKEFIIHIEKFETVEHCAWWRADPSNICGDYIQEILFEKGRMSEDMFARLTKK